MPNIIRCGGGSSGFSTLPAQISNFAATIDNQSNILNWQNPDDSNFAGVLIVRKTGGYPDTPYDGTRIYDGAGASYTDTGLTNGTQYYYRAYAYNSSRQYQTIYCVAAGTPTDDIKISTLPVGAAVGLYENGVEAPYIVIQHGLPSKDYDVSCNGTWLLRKDILTNHAWGNSDQDYNEYRSSVIYRYLRDTVINIFSANFQSRIKSIKIPSRNSEATSCQSIDAKLFLLSIDEVGILRSNPEGAKLDYFLSGLSDAANAKHLSYYNGSANVWWLRTTDNDNEYAHEVYNDGGILSTLSKSNAFGVRPALILDGESNRVHPALDKNGCYAIAE